MSTTKRAQWVKMAKSAAFWITGTITALSLTAVAGNLDSKGEETSLLKQTRERILTFLYIAREESLLYKGCLSLESGHPDYRWLSDRQLDSRQIDGTCRAKLNELRQELRTRFRQMRIALALTAPGIREDRILDAVPTRIQTWVKHPFFGTARLAPLDASETAEALRLYEVMLQQGRREYALKNPNRGADLPSSYNRPHYDPDEESFVMKRIESGRREYVKKYFQAISEMPLLVFLKSANPGTQELGNALDEISSNNSKLISKIERADLHDEWTYAGFLPAMSQVVEEHPELAQAARDWRERFESREHRKKTTKSVIEVSLLAAGLVFEGEELIAPIIEAFETANMFYGVISNSLNYRSQYVKIASSVRGMAGNEAIESMEEGARELMLSHVLIANWIRH